MGPDAPNWVDIQDLLAQQKMARLAEQVLYLTWAQAVIGVLGAIALLYTLRESRKATATALRAIRVQQTAERGVLVVRAPTLGRSGRDANDNRTSSYSSHTAVAYDLSASVKLTNVGKSLALLRKSRAVILLAKQLPKAPSYPSSARTRNHSPVDVGADINVSTKLRLSAEQTDKLKAGELTAWIAGEVEYDDLFGEKHLMSFCYRYTLGGQMDEDGAENYWTSY